MRRPLILAAVSFGCILQAGAQSKMMLGFTGGANISRLTTIDSFPGQYSRRNRLGPSLGISGLYNLNNSVGLHFGLNMVNKGYKVSNDTLATDAQIVRKFWSVNVPLGLNFRQGFGKSNYLTEKFGLIGNFSLRPDSSSFSNGKQNRYRLTEINHTNPYAMFYLGFGLGGSTESGDRYDFGVTYVQSFSRDTDIRVNYGSGLSKMFPLQYRGGFLQIGFTYYFNLENFKKGTGYME
ncbi:MAG: hypothetical protein JNL57_09930 [Bacteroidetes bacterium]|nr:hypothetical protein [Bacteroidota bacterium]